jgi:hypothetical protein
MSLLYTPPPLPCPLPPNLWCVKPRLAGLKRRAARRPPGAAQSALGEGVLTGTFERLCLGEHVAGAGAGAGAAALRATVQDGRTRLLEQYQTLRARQQRETGATRRRALERVADANVRDARLKALADEAARERAARRDALRARAAALERAGRPGWETEARALRVEARGLARDAPAPVPAREAPGEHGHLADYVYARAAPLPPGAPPGAPLRAPAEFRRDVAALANHDPRAPPPAPPAPHPLRPAGAAAAFLFDPSCAHPALSVAHGGASVPPPPPFSRRTAAAAAHCRRARPRDAPGGAARTGDA